MLETHTIFDETNDSLKKSAEHCVTDLREAVRDANRVNVYVDDKFFCSLDISQVVDLKIKIGKKLVEDELAELKRASDFGKFYSQALAYVMMRPRSAKEIRDYLKKKTFSRKIRARNPKTGEYCAKVREGYDAKLIEPVFNRLEERGYVDDEAFASAWIENRQIAKGISRQKLRQELQQKGIPSQVIDNVLTSSIRDERADLRKAIARKTSRYPDRQKLIQYLLRQGFNYSDVVDELSAVDSSSV